MTKALISILIVEDNPADTSACDLAQCYLFCNPLPAGEASEFLRKRKVREV